MWVVSGVVHTLIPKATFCLISSDMNVDILLKYKRCISDICTDSLHYCCCFTLNVLRQRQCLPFRKGVPPKIRIDETTLKLSSLECWPKNNTADNHKHVCKTRVHSEHYDSTVDRSYHCSQQQPRLLNFWKLFHHNGKQIIDSPQIYILLKFMWSLVSSIPDISAT